MSDQISLSKEAFQQSISKTSSKTGVLLVHLGTPNDLTEASIKTFLKNMLTDPFVIHKQGFFWRFTLKNFILPKRTKTLLAKFQNLHEKYGPFYQNTAQSITQKLYEHLSSVDPFIVVRHGMHYSDPNLKNILTEMIEEENCEKILILPMFPQYSHTTTGSVQNTIRTHVKTLKKKAKLKLVSSFCNFEGYIKSLASLIQTHINTTPKPERLILSYHGLPKSYIAKGDPYQQMCEVTSHHLKEALDYPDEYILTSYQSRFGKEEWITPYTNQTIVQLAKQGIKNIAIACPSFTVDCLETLDEHNNLTPIPCLNDTDHWMIALSDLIKKELTF